MHQSFPWRYKFPSNITKSDNKIACHLRYLKIKWIFFVWKDETNLSLKNKVVEITIDLRKFVLEYLFYRNKFNPKFYIRYISTHVSCSSRYFNGIFLFLDICVPMGKIVLNIISATKCFEFFDIFYPNLYFKSEIFV